MHVWHCTDLRIYDVFDFINIVANCKQWFKFSSRTNETTRVAKKSGKFLLLEIEKRHWKADIKLLISSAYTD